MADQLIYRKVCHATRRHDDTKGSLYLPSMKFKCENHRIRFFHIPTYLQILHGATTSKIESYIRKFRIWSMMRNIWPNLWTAVGKENNLARSVSISFNLKNKYAPVTVVWVSIRLRFNFVQQKRKALIIHKINTLIPFITIQLSRLRTIFNDWRKKNVSLLQRFKMSKDG